jgi:hypothetical protein
MEPQFTLTWLQMKEELERRLKRTDSELRRAVEPKRTILQGKAQAYEELLNMPETYKTLKQMEKDNG